MRIFLLMAAAVLAFGGTMTVVTTDANAVVCARGVYRAGCAGARGAVVVRRPARRSSGGCSPGGCLPHRMGEWRPGPPLQVVAVAATRIFALEQT